MEKSTLKRFTTIVVVLFLSLSLAPFATAQAAEKPSAWAEVEVIAAIAEGLVPQDLQSKYTQATTRAEFCALAVALYEKMKGVVTERQGFDDTSDVNVEKAAAVGIVNGVGEGRFDPNANLTREQAATMLARLADAVGEPLSKTATTFGDKGSVSDWAVEAVGQVQAAGIMQGIGNNTFAPKDSYTREQSILTVLRLYNYLQFGTQPGIGGGDFGFGPFPDELVFYAISLGYSYPPEYWTAELNPTGIRIRHWIRFSKGGNVVQVDKWELVAELKGLPGYEEIKLYGIYEGTEERVAELFAENESNITIEGVGIVKDWRDIFSALDRQSK